MPLDHLGLGRVMLVQTVKCVEHHIAVDLCEPAAAPDRIELGKPINRDELEGAGTLRLCNLRRCQHGGAGSELKQMPTQHEIPLPWRLSLIKTTSSACGAESVRVYQYPVLLPFNPVCFFDPMAAVDRSVMCLTAAHPRSSGLSALASMAAVGEQPSVGGARSERRRLGRTSLFRDEGGKVLNRRLLIIPK